MMSEIKTPCPSCGSKSLFIGTGGHLTCSWLECPEPGVERAIAALKGELANEQSKHNFALALMQKAIDAADIYRDELLGFYTENYIDVLLTTEEQEDA